MKNLQRGQRLSLPNDIFSLSVKLDAKSENLVFDVSCFGLDEKGKLSDDRFFVFYNQPCAPGRCIQLLQPKGDELGHFILNLKELPPAICKLVWVLTIDGESSMSALQEGRFHLGTPSGELATFDFAGTDFSTERSVMVAELYEREGWRLGAIGKVSLVAWTPYYVILEVRLKGRKKFRVQSITHHRFPMIFQKRRKYPAMNLRRNPSRHLPSLSLSLCALQLLHRPYRPLPQPLQPS